jgi:predicted metal-dependent hydrolase
VNDSLVIDGLSFALRWSERRKTIGITVDRDGALILSAPLDCPTDTVERLAHEKLFWVYTKLAEKELLFRPASPQEYVSGEGFHYLGRSYRLRLIAPSSDGLASPPLRLHRGRFELRRDERDRAHDHFVTWYIDHGAPWLQRRVDLYAGRIGVTPRSIEVRHLGYRWGSCSRSGAIRFHWRTLLLPPRIIDYIAVHELVHLREHRHTAGFWQRVERAMPDYQQRKRWLAENGSRY